MSKMKRMKRIDLFVIAACLLILGLIFSGCIRESKNIRNINSTAGHIDKIESSVGRIRHRTSSIRIEMDDTVFNLSYNNSGRKFENIKALFDAIHSELTPDNVAEITYVQEQKGQNFVVGLICNDREIVNFDSAYGTYKRDLIIGAFASLVLLTSGLGVLIYALLRI